MLEKNNIFREKSLKRVSSPEDLDKYIKTTTPSLWLLLISIIALLVGIIVWGIIGKVETYSDIGVNVNNKVGIAYIKETDYEKLSNETFIKIEDKEYPIDKVEGPYEVNADSEAFLLHASDINEGEWYYLVSFNTSASSGNYNSKIVYETISPISFIIN